jgi:hypothetical protein
MRRQGAGADEKAGIFLQMSQKEIILFKNLRRGKSKAMSTGLINVKGYVIAIPRSMDARQARVAIVQDDVEYRVMPRGAGVDLDDEVSVPVEAYGLHEEREGVNYLTVLNYKVLEDDSWIDE